MKITLEDLYKTLGRHLEEEPWCRDLIITDVECSSLVGRQTSVKVEERLQRLKIIAVSENENLAMIIEDFHQ